MLSLGQREAALRRATPLPPGPLPRVQTVIPSEWGRAGAGSKTVQAGPRTDAVSAAGRPSLCISTDVAGNTDPQPSP